MTSNTKLCQYCDMVAEDFEHATAIDCVDALKAANSTFLGEIERLRGLIDFAGGYLLEHRQMLKGGGAHHKLVDAVIWLEVHLAKQRGDAETAPPHRFGSQAAIVSESLPSNPNNGLLQRLRARLVLVPKPGTEPWETEYPITLTIPIGGEHKAGDDAGIQQVQSLHYTGAANKPKLQQHIYATEPLCLEAADAIERLTREREQLIARCEAMTISFEWLRCLERLAAAGGHDPK